MSEHHDEQNRHGVVTDYSPPQKRATVQLSGNVGEGDRVHIIGPRTNLEETVTKLEVNGSTAAAGAPGDVVSFPVRSMVRAGDALHREL
jgi:hypothetical protein